MKEFSFKQGMALSTVRLEKSSGEKKELKDLRKQREGSGSNVLPFEQPELATAPTPPGSDWLRTLPHGARFVAKGMNYKGPWLEHYGIGMVLPKTILLARPSSTGMGMEWTWVDSKVFSQQNILVEIIPDMKELEQPAEE